MNTKNKTFAERAKKIVKSFKRADWDPIEKTALESSLEKLQQEQEAFKQFNQIGEYACGGKMYGHGSTLNNEYPSQYIIDDFYMDTKPNQSIEVDSSPGFRTIGSPTKPINVDSKPVETIPKEVVVNKPKITKSKEKRPTFEPMYPIHPKSGIIETNLTEESHGLNIPKDYLPKTKNTTLPEDTQYLPYKTSLLPTLTSGAISTLGNLYLANQQNSSPRVNLPRVASNDISLARSRESLKREAAKGASRARYAAKEGSRTRGEYMAGRIAGESQISGALGEALSASHEKEAIINANMKDGMNKFNAELAAKEEMINKAQFIQDKKEREAYLAAAIGSIPQMNRDIGTIKAQDNMINMLGDEYGLYTEKDSRTGRKRTVKGFYNAETGEVIPIRKNNRKIKNR